MAILFSAFLAVSTPVQSNVTEWMSLDHFLMEAFADQKPDAEVLWITPELREDLEKVLNRKFQELRIRYWKEGARTAWTLDQIGKERPITAGFVVEGGKLVSAHVLVYRESRGGEIRYESFRDQFVDAELEGGKLDRHIDGITGATLSVRSMTQMAAAALLLHAHVVGDGSLHTD